MAAAKRAKMAEEDKSSNGFVEEGGLSAHSYRARQEAPQTLVFSD